MHFLYSLAVTCVLIVGLPLWLVQIIFKPKYRAGLAERLGRVPSRLRPTARNENCIWVHAVSVGEVLAVSRLIQEFKTRFPEWRLAVSTTTLSGQTLARKKFGEADVFYLPLDLKVFSRPFFERLRPRLLVMAESEFWPNLFDIAQKTDCRVAVVNARVSDRSFPRYRRFSRLLGKYVMSRIDLVLAQSELDAERLCAIGTRRSQVQVSGNLKFELQPPAESDLARTLRERTPASVKVVVCGSTVHGEEALLVPALKRWHDQEIAVVLAPRHPERFDSVAAWLTSAGLSVQRRSAWKGEPLRGGQIFLLDSIGELAAIYALADVAFVGGSLLPHGGHNILEPAHFGKAIVVGPSTENFRDIIQRFAAADALITTTADRFANTVEGLLSDPGRLADLGKRASAVIEGNRGATERTLSALEVLLWMPETLRVSMSRGAE